MHRVYMILLAVMVLVACNDDAQVTGAVVNNGSGLADGVQINTPEETAKVVVDNTRTGGSICGSGMCPIGSPGFISDRRELEQDTQVYDWFFTLQTAVSSDVDKTYTLRYLEGTDLTYELHGQVTKMKAKRSAFTPSELFEIEYDREAKTLLFKGLINTGVSLDPDEEGNKPALAVHVVNREFSLDQTDCTLAEKSHKISADADTKATFLEFQCDKAKPAIQGSMRLPSTQEGDPSNVKINWGQRPEFTS